MAKLHEDQSTLTDERYRHAIRAGGGVESIDILSRNGFPTGNKRRRVVSPIELLFKKGSLDARQFQACQTYSELHYALRACMGGTSSAYSPRFDGGGGGVSPIEHRIHLASQIAHAKEAIHRSLWPIVDWIGEGYENGIPLSDLYKIYNPASSRAVASAAVTALLRHTAVLLADHFEGTHRRGMSRKII
jgi:hypothetical protein